MDNSYIHRTERYAQILVPCFCENENEDLHINDIIERIEKSKAKLQKETGTDFVAVYYDYYAYEYILISYYSKNDFIKYQEEVIKRLEMQENNAIEVKKIKEKMEKVINKYFT